ncbi:MAG: phage tail protein [Roseovarius confluentis]
MIEPMLQLGGFQFSISTAAYEELSRGAEYRWAAQQRVGAVDVLQFTGRAAETIELRGKIYPAYKGGLGQVEDMRAQAGRGKPLRLISGGGRLLGEWVIEAVREGQRVFAAGGIPLRQEFEMRLRQYDAGLRSNLSIF